MSEEFIYYSSNFTDWKYNKMINSGNVDPFDSNKILNTCNYNLYKYNCLIFLDVILTYTIQYLKSDVLLRTEYWSRISLFSLIQTNPPPQRTAHRE